MHSLLLRHMNCLIISSVWSSLRLRPTFGYGWGTREDARQQPHSLLGPHGNASSHKHAPIAYLLLEVSFELEGPIVLILMLDESMTQGIEEFVLPNFNSTRSYWGNGPANFVWLSNGKSRSPEPAL